MPFDAAGFPDDDEPADPTPVARWLRYWLAALVILVGLALPIWAGAWGLWRAARDIGLL